MLRFNKVDGVIGVGTALVCKAHCFGETIQATLGIEIKHYTGIILWKMEDLHSSCGKNNCLFVEPWEGGASSLLSYGLLDLLSWEMQVLPHLPLHVFNLLFLSCFSEFSFLYPFLLLVLFSFYLIVLYLSSYCTPFLPAFLWCLS